MKFMHLSDLHIGKRINEYSMLEDQRYILNKILEIARDESPDAIIIAGDIYDRASPPAEAVALFDSFLVSIAKLDIIVLAISGNHDSPERTAFGAELMKKSGVYLTPVYNGHISPLSFTKDNTQFDIYMLPFIKPANVRMYTTSNEINSYNAAIQAALSNLPTDKQNVNILITHQFVSGGVSCDSEEVSVGGIDSISTEIFAEFDYVALGHLHRPQNVAPNIRYSGSPLKYSFSEAPDIKSVTIVDIQSKGAVNLRQIPLIPLRDMREIKGNYLELTSREYYSTISTEDYFHVVLTDEYDIPGAITKLRTIYPNIMRLGYDNNRTRTSCIFTEIQDQENKSPLDLFCELYLLQNGTEMSLEQRTLSASLIDSIWREHA